MNAKHTISINGRPYDAVTGLPLDGVISESKPVAAPVHTPLVQQAPVHREPTHPSTAIHRQIHKSSTLRRGPLPVPVGKIPVSAPKHEAGHVSQSTMISHFANHPKPLSKNRTVRVINDIGPVARHAVTAPSTQAQLPSKQVKEQLIAKAGNHVDRVLASAPDRAKKPKRAPLLKRLSKSHFVAAGIAVLLLGGYVTYLNVPGISVRVAAVQAGVDARYPNYNPDGYSFQGPVAFEQGEVDLLFKSNGGGQGYTIRQRNSDWNSVAVLDNLVNKASKGEYEVNSAGGITIYTYGTRAAWTNGGVLYTIDGEAPLSSEQLLHIASSM